jgi:hypothetical protein
VEFRSIYEHFSSPCWKMGVGFCNQSPQIYHQWNKITFRKFQTFRRL